MENRDISFHWGPALQDEQCSPLLDSSPGDRAKGEAFVMFKGRDVGHTVSRSLGITTSTQPEGRTKGNACDQQLVGPLEAHHGDRAPSCCVYRAFNACRDHSEWL